jgi:hypothetical protein
MLELTETKAPVMDSLRVLENSDPLWHALCR